MIRRNDGVISDYIGDGLIALFGVEDSDEAMLNAVKAGLEMFAVVEELNPYLEGFKMYEGRHFQIWIGMHFGEVVVGTIGVADMTKVVAIGDAVNFASRIKDAKTPDLSMMGEPWKWDLTNRELLAKDGHTPNL